MPPPVLCRNTSTTRYILLGLYFSAIENIPPAHLVDAYLLGRRHGLGMKFFRMPEFQSENLLHQIPLDCLSHYNMLPVHI